jgi:hypothetical protein
MHNLIDKRSPDAAFYQITLYLTLYLKMCRPLWVNAKGLFPRTSDNVPADLKEKVSVETVAMVDALRDQRLTQGEGTGGVELRARYLVLQRKGAFNTNSKLVGPAQLYLALDKCIRKVSKH